MVEWVKEHPYLSGGLVLALIVLFLVLRGRGSSSQQVRAGGPSESLQAAQMQTQLQQQGIQAQADAHAGDTAAALAAKMAETDAQNFATQSARDVALQNIAIAGQTEQYKTQVGGSVAMAGYASQAAIADTQASAAVSIASTQANAGVQIAGINAGAAVGIAGIQGDVAKHQFDAQLAGLRDTNATSVALGNLQLAGLVDTNKSAVDIIGLQEGTKRFAIGTAGDVSKLGIAADFGLQSQGMTYAYDLQQQNQTEYWKSIFANDRWGGGLNQVAALAAVTGNTGIGVTAAGGQAQSNVASSNMWASIVQSLTRGAVGVAAAGA